VSALTAPAEHSLRTEAPGLDGARRAGGHAPLGGLLRVDALWWPTILITGIVCFVTFLAGGGLHLGPTTAVEMALTIGAGVVVAGAVLLAPARGRAYGGWSVGLLLALTALTALSVVWSVQPDDSFKDAGRMLAYSGVFGASVALARATPTRWPAVLGAVTLAAVVVCGYALLTKVFPRQFDANDVYARLRAPYDYWNALGLTAAMGAICCLWLGARRAGHALLSALAYPAMGLMLVTLMLAYSRGALVALAVGVAVWFCIVPLRLRGAAVLLSGAVGAGLVVAWDFSRRALSTEGVALATRATAGRQLGALLAAMLLLLALVGLAIGFITGRQAPSRKVRRRAGAALLALLILAVVASAGALAVSHRGLPGSISHAFHSLTDTHAKVPNTPGRLTAIASVRARYWDEALKVFKAHPALGAGAEGYRTARLRYRTAPIEVRHAHGFVVQTLADLGVVGLALALALLLAWMVAAGRSTHPLNRRWTSRRTPREEKSGWRPGWRPGWRRISAPHTPERVGMLSMLCVVLVFGIHSLVDWTWYVPGTACVALLCAGWLAGRGPLEPATVGGRADGGLKGSPGAPLRRLSPLSATVASAVVIAALLAAWAQWQPVRAEDASQRALLLVASDFSAASAAAQTAIADDPLSVQALFSLSTVQQATGSPELARATLQRAVRLQPSNPETWLRLGEYDLSTDRSNGGGANEGGARSALTELGAAIYLNPESIAPELIAQGNSEAITIQNDYVEALRASTPAPAQTSRKQSARLPKPRASKAPR
jgi:tetratricopeptide (TPR) repeat protein